VNPIARRAPAAALFGQRFGSAVVMGAVVPKLRAAGQHGGQRAGGNALETARPFDCVQADADMFV